MKTKFIIGLIILLTFAGWYAYRAVEEMTMRNVFKPSKIEQEAVKQIQTEATEIAREVRANGYTHTVYRRAKEVDRSEIDKIEADLLDTIEALNIARKQLVNVQVASARVHIQNQKLQKRVDALATIYTHEDANAKIAFNVPNDSTQSASFDLAYDADIVTTDYWKRKWVFGPRLGYTDIYSNDPRMTIGGLKKLTIANPLKKFGVDIQASTSYNFESDILRVGPGIAIRIGRIALEGRYMLDPSRNKWGMVASGNYNLFSF